MNTRETSIASVEQSVASDIDVLDIIPHEVYFERAREIPIKYRHALGRSAVDKAVASVLRSIDFPVADPQEDAFIKQGAPEFNADQYDSIDFSTASKPVRLFEQSNDELEEDTRTPLTIKKALGRAAMPIKWLDSKISAAAVDVISRLPGSASKEEMYERDRLNREKFADNEDFNAFKRAYYAYRRNKVKIISYTPVAAMGMLAVERFTAIGFHYEHVLDGTLFADQVNPQPLGPMEFAQPPQPEIPALMAGSSVYVAGGAGQGDIPQAVIDEMHVKGLDLGVNIEGVNYSAEGVRYSAQIGPVVGTERMDVSGAAGGNNMYSQSIDDLKAGKPVQYVGYSEGTLVALDAYDQAVAANGGVAPANLLPPILVAAPYAQGGIFDNPLTGGLVGNVLNGMGIPTDRKLPPGTIIKYYDSDIYANGGNMNPATLIKNALGLAAGNHEIPNESDPHYSFTDSDGVIHVVYSRDDQFLTILEKSGIKVLDTENANKAFEAFFPIGKDADGNFLKPDVRAGLSYIAVTLDHQIDPSGNLHIMQDFMANMPDEWKELGQRGMDGFNNIAEMAGKIQSGEVDPFTGFMSIMGSISSIFGGLQGISGGQQSGGASYNFDWTSYSASAMASFDTDQDYGVQLNALVQGYFCQFNPDAQAQFIASTPSVQAPYDYTQQSQIATQFNSYHQELTIQAAEQASSRSGYTVQVSDEISGQNTTYVVNQDGVTRQEASTVQTPAASEQEPASQQPVVPEATSQVPSANPETQPVTQSVQEVAPTTPSKTYEAPAVEQAPVSTPEPVVNTPEPAAPIAVEQAPNTVITPEPVQEAAPTPPPAETYVPPAQPEPTYEAPAAPVTEPTPPPVAYEAPVPAPEPIFSVFQAPSLQNFFSAPSFDSSPSSSISQSPSFGSSSSSSSSSTPSLVSAGVDE